MSKKSRSIELFLVDGEPDGMLTATIPFQWTGHVLVFNRTQLKDALNREETRRSGVYFLLGENEEGELLYIGESDDINRRIKNHDLNKEFWNRAIFITSSGEALNKAHIKYLESRLIEQVQKAKKVTLANGNTPALSTLSEAARAHMEDFLDNIFVVLPMLNFNFFNIKAIKEKEDKVVEMLPSPLFELKTLKHNIHATAYLKDGQFIVKEGSYAKKEWSHKPKHNSYYKLSDELIAQGILVPLGDILVFTQDYPFNSTSAAGAVINARATRGPIEWKLQNSSKTYREWEEEEINKEKL